LPFVNAAGAEAWLAEGGPFGRVGFNARARVTVGYDDLWESIRAQGPTPGLLELLGAASMVGRPFTMADAVGSTIELDDRRHRIIGVMAHDFRFPTFSVTDIWVPLLEDWTVVGQTTSQIQMTLRIPEGQLQPTLEKAEAYAGGIQETGWAGSGWMPDLLPLNVPSVQGDVQRALWVTFGSVGLMLLIALVNGVNLMLARGTTRGREIGLRLALGGSKTRVAGQLFVESLVLAAFAGGTAVLFAFLGVEALMSIAPQDFTAFASRPIEMDGRVLAFTGGLSMVVGLLFGVLPDGSQLLFIGARRSGIRRTGPRGRVDQFVPATLVERLRSVSGITAATYSIGVPPGTGITFGDGLWSDRDPEPLMEGSVYLPHVSAQHDFAALLGVRLRAGRLLTAGDEAAERPVVIETELAMRLGGIQESVGTRFGLDPQHTSNLVVGVIEDFKVMGLDDRFGDFAMISLMRPESLSSFFTVAFRTSGPIEPVLPAIRQIVRQMDPRQPIQSIESVDAGYAESVSRPRFFLTLMAIFVVLALTLASVGLYGVLSFGVGQRTREVGVRVALGAGAGRIGHLILKGGMRMALLGVVLGVLLSLWASRVLESLLFQTSATDVVTLVAAASLMLCVAALASWIPAGRAARLDPVQALKTE